MVAEQLRARWSRTVETDPDKERVRRVNVRRVTIITALAILMVGLMSYSITIGSTTITPLQVYGVLLNQVIPGLYEVPYKTEQIILQVYAPRVLMATFVGAILAIAGCLIQTIMKNPLATPYTLGVSGSAAFGASLSIIMGISATVGTMGTITNAFLFSLIPAGVILVTSARRNVMPSTLILVGISISYIFTAATTIMQYFGAADAVKSALFWSVGDLNSASLWQVPYVLVMFIAILAVTTWLVKDINIMRMGDDTALSLGVDVKRVRVAAILIACFSTAVVVSFTGAIGFVCLLAPHISRILVGSDLRYLFPASAVMGALLLSSADIIAKDLINPIMLPVGAITALIGGPLLIYMLLTRRDALVI
ncbi:MAG: iron ABC transporter permease [Methanomassiliicoccus sp.]|nr:iron ABC transporter permease [Methanomassiliicoccus sp.]